MNAAAIAEMQRRSAAGNVRFATASITGHDANDPAIRSRAIGEALASRMTGQAPTEMARDFVGLTAVELCRDLLRQRGLSDRGSPGVIVERALTQSRFSGADGRRGELVDEANVSCRSDPP